MDRILPAQLATLLDGDDEIAIIDVREQGIFARGHLLFARSVPLSTLELKISDLVPRKSTRIVVCAADELGDDEELLARACTRLRDLGYGDVVVLAGGNAGWQAAGHQLFSGINVPSKAFGEVVEEHFGTPSLTAPQLSALLASGQPVKVFDSRPPDEFRRMSIPGAVDCPGAELVHRVPELVPSTDTIVVVNCAGRTRSIVGAQSLINAELPNRVFALRNGTMGWELAGFSVDRGKEEQAPLPSPRGLAAAQAMAKRFGATAGLTDITWADYQRLKDDAQRTCYLFDVRSQEEFLAGHPGGAVFAAGGQLVQATDVYVGTLRSRIVLFDEKQVRAVMTAAWLRLAGWDEVFVLTVAPDHLMQAGPRRPLSEPALDRTVEISPDQLEDGLMRGGVHLIDLATSAQFLDGHIAGARFAIRARLPASLHTLTPQRDLVLTSPDSIMAHIACREVGPGWPGSRKVLEGGTAAWRAAGKPVETGFDYERALAPPEDLWHAPSSFFGGGKPAMQQYIDWETGLVERIRNEPGLRFKLPL